jgi:hypothetical protein
MEIYCCPGKLLAFLGIREENRIHAGYVFSSVLVLLISPVLVRLPHVCLFKLISGLPCPGCGITHSIAALTSFNLSAAWQSNPAGIFVVVCVLFQLVARPLAIMHPLTGPNVHFASKWIGHAAFTALLVVWVVRIGNLLI